MDQCDVMRSALLEAHDDSRNAVRTTRETTASHRPSLQSITSFKHRIASRIIRFLMSD